MSALNSSSSSRSCSSSRPCRQQKFKSYGSSSSRIMAMSNQSKQQAAAHKHKHFCCLRVLCCVCVCIAEKKKVRQWTVVKMCPRRESYIMHHGSLWIMESCTRRYKSCRAVSAARESEHESDYLASADLDCEKLRELRAEGTTTRVVRASASASASASGSIRRGGGFLFL